MRSLYDRLAAASREHRLYACVDLASAPQALQKIPAPDAERRCLFEGALVDDAKQVAPWVIAIDPLSLPTMLERTIRVAGEAPAVSWIASKLDLDALASRLRRRVDVVLPASESVILRYFDPRILEVLSECLTPQQHSAFFALGSQWLFVDRDQTVRSIALSPPGDGDPVQAPFSLQEAQEDALVEASEAGQLVGTALERAPLLLGSLAPGARFRLAKRCAQAMVEIGIDGFPAKLALFMLTAPSAGEYLDSSDWKRDRLRLQSKSVEMGTWLDELAEKEDAA